MFFQDHEKRIYQPPGSEVKYDPIRVDRILTVVTKGRLNEYIVWRNAIHDDKGDVSEQGKNTSREMSARAEIELADAARQAFGLNPFPDVTDAQALETLYDFLGWMEGKGERARKPQDSPTTSPVQTSLLETMKSGLGSFSMSKQPESEGSSTERIPTELQQEFPVSRPNG